MRLLFTVLTAIFLLSLSQAQTSSLAKPVQPKPAVQTASAESLSDARLPIKRVVLYKNGVGYFEHSAKVHGNQDLSIDFTTAQLNDVLKSLTVVDLGEGHIANVRYNSIAPLDERLKGLRLPFGESVTRADYLTAMRGARVEVHSGSAIATGRLLSVEKEKRFNEKGDSYEVTEFSIITESGEMRNFDLNAGTSLRLAEHDLNDEVGKYLNLVGSSRARDLRRMTISAAGSGDREIFVSYISEVPVWKSTYRIIISATADEKAKEHPLLQGWAIVDNTVGEDWKDVQLSLVAGAPQSFIQDISQPFYARRPVVALPPSVMLTPQEHEGTQSSQFDRLEQYAKVAEPPPPPFGASSLRGTVTDMTGAAVPGARVTVRNDQNGATQSTTSDARGVYQFYNVPMGNSALFVDSPGFKRFDLSNFFIGSGRSNEIDARLEVGTVAETVTVQATPVTLNTESAEVSSVNSAIAKQHVEAEGKAMGDYFEYDIKQKIIIGKNQSALVPILQAHIEAEKVSLWSEGSQEIRRALWITNSSGMTLDSGTFNILDADTFAGEGLLDTVHPAERRLISYAADPALRITMDEEGNDKPSTHVRIAKGIMVLTHEQRDKRKYTLHNSDTTLRQVVIEHPAREGWKLAEGAKPEETSASFLRFRVGVGPGKTENLEIEEYHPEDTEYELSELDDKQVTLITQQKAVTPALQEVFRKVLAQKNLVDSLEAQIKQRQQEVEAITRDQARLRENMKALKGSAEEKALLQRYTHQLDSQEDRLSALSKDITDLQEKNTLASEQLDQMVQQVTLDENF